MFLIDQTQTFQVRGGDGWNVSSNDLNMNSLIKYPVETSQQSNTSSVHRTKQQSENKNMEVFHTSLCVWCGSCASRLEPDPHVSSTDVLFWCVWHKRSWSSARKCLGVIMRPSRVTGVKQSAPSYTQNHRHHIYFEHENSFTIKINKNRFDQFDYRSVSSWMFLRSEL